MDSKPDRLANISQRESEKQKNEPRFTILFFGWLVNAFLLLGYDPV